MRDEVFEKCEDIRLLEKQVRKERNHTLRNNGYTKNHPIEPNPSRAAAQIVPVLLGLGRSCRHRFLIGVQA